MANIWIFQALGASLMWAIGYVFSEKLLKAGVTPMFFLVFMYVVSFPIYIAIMGGIESIQKNIEVLQGSKTILVYTIIASIAFLFGNLFVFEAMANKNATIVSLIEASYPLFIVLFTWIIFKEVQLNWTQAFGGVLILAGAGLIYLKS